LDRYLRVQHTASPGKST
jgi:hypothetical protein